MNTELPGEHGEPTEPVKTWTWSAWKVGVSVFALVLLLFGGVLALAGGGEDEAATETAGIEAEPLSAPAAGPGVQGFGPGGTTLPPTGVPPGETPGENTAGVEAPAPETTSSPWSPALMRGGLGYFIGLAMAFALRAFLKVAMFFAGLWALSLFLLAQAGFIEVHWDLMNDAFVGWTQRIGEQFASLTTFITGSLPTVGMGGLGLYTGFRRS